MQHPLYLQTTPLENIVNALVRRLRKSEAGLSIVEVVVAMFIFAIISTGTLYTMVTVLQTTRDSRAKQVAANLAAQDIDLARDYANLFQLLPTSYTVPLNGDTFTVTRDTEWVTGAGNDVKCETGGAALNYKRVNVTVTWDNMASSTKPVRSDTVIDPNSRITDPTKGTILVYVRTGSGAGTPGVVVSATPSSTPNGAQKPSPSSAVTDATGCAYILKVTPGNYDITISHPSGKYVDEQQKTESVKNLGLQANATASAGFQYALGGSILANYASNYVNSTRPFVATDMATLFSSTYGAFAAPRAPGDTFLLHPFQSGYEIIGGDPTDCLAMDAEMWTPDILGRKAEPAPTSAASSGSTVAVGIPLGVVEIATTDGGGNRYLRAVSVDNPANGQPTCLTPTTLHFGKLIPKDDDDDPIRVAVPFGTWIFYADKDEDVPLGLLTDRVGRNGTTTIKTVTQGSVVDSSIVTLDPRVVVS